jgi:hypothetical protein
LGSTPQPLQSAEENPLEQSLEIADRITDEFMRAISLSRIANHSLRLVNDPANAIAIAEKIPKSQRFLEATASKGFFIDFVFDLAMKGHIKEAIEMGLKETNLRAKFYCLWDIGTLIRDEKTLEAFEKIVLEHMNRELASCRDPRIKDDCLATMTYELIIRKRWNDALALSHSFYDNSLEDVCLERIARDMAQEEAFDSAIEMARRIGDEVSRDYCYEFISEKLIEKLAESPPPQEGEIEIDLSGISKLFTRP